MQRDQIETGKAYRNQAGDLYRVLMRHGQKLTISGPEGKVGEMSLGRFAAQMTRPAYGELRGDDDATR